MSEILKQKPLQLSRTAGHQYQASSTQTPRQAAASTDERGPGRDFQRQADHLQPGRCLQDEQPKALLQAEGLQWQLERGQGDLEGGVVLQEGHGVRPVSIDEYGYRLGRDNLSYLCFSIVYKDQRSSFRSKLVEFPELTLRK